MLDVEAQQPCPGRRSISRPGSPRDVPRSSSRAGPRRPPPPRGATRCRPESRAAPARSSCPVLQPSGRPARGGGFAAASAGRPTDASGRSRPGEGRRGGSPRPDGDRQLASRRLPSRNHRAAPTSIPCVCTGLLCPGPMGSGAQDSAVRRGDQCRSAVRREVLGRARAEEPAQRSGPTAGAASTPAGSASRPSPGPPERSRRRGRCPRPRPGPREVRPVSPGEGGLLRSPRGAETELAALELLRREHGSIRSDVLQPEIRRARVQLARPPLLGDGEQRAARRSALR